MVKITSDSTCDLPPDILDELDITLVPLHIQIDGKEYRDGVDIEPQDIFRAVEKDGKICQTAAVNAYEYEEFFWQYAAVYDAVIHIGISSLLSACYQNAELVAQRFDNVYVIDSRNLSSGSGHVVYEAALMAKHGMIAEEIRLNLAELIPKVDASFMVSRMDYLYRGGRCSGLKMIGATILQIKPCIEVVNGKMIVGRKYRGSFDNCLKQYVKDKLRFSENIDFSRVFITHPMCSPQTVEKVRALLDDFGGFEQIIETPAGCTVSSHCGPETLGILFKRKTAKRAVTI